jgi:intracellular multiplication protein IcmK
MIKKIIGYIICVMFAVSGNTQNAGGYQAAEQLKMLQSQLESGSGKTSNDSSRSKNNAGSQDNLEQLTKQFSALQPGGNSQAKNDSNPSQDKSNPPPPQNPVPYQQQSTGNVEASTKEDNEMIDELAFEKVENQLFPMSEKNIKDLRSKYQDVELAKTAVPSPPTPVATSQFVNLSPGSTPPVVRLAQGFVTSLVFLDSTGAPWPISAYDLGDPSTFNIQWDKTSNTLMIQSTKLYNYGNMAVRLEGLNTPVMLTLIPGQKEVDYRVDMRVQGLGPNAQMPVLGDNLPPSANKLLLHVLDGVPPPGSTRLTVSGGDARAWLFRNKMYVRTNLTILSPAWLSTMVSADGMHAYEMQKSPVILVTWHGKVMQLKIEGL